MYGLQNQQYISIKINSQAYTPQISSPMTESMTSQWTSRSPVMTPITPCSQISDSQFREYLNVWKTDISIPVLAYQKVLKIIDEYILLKPNLQKKQQELQTLLNYNTKLIEAMDSFQAHQKKILDVCNYLVKLYAKTFKKHFQNRQKQFDQNIFKQMHSIFDTFSMKDWQVDPKTIELPKVNLKYKQYLFKIMLDHYIYPNQQLHKLVKKKTLSAQNNTSQQKLWEKLQQKIKDFNKIAQKTTIDNMFDVYEKKRKIIEEVKFFHIQSEAIQAENIDRFSRIKNLKKSNSKQLETFQQNKSYDELDERFVHAVKRLHSDLQQADPVKIRKYVIAQIQYRNKLKRRQLKQKKRFQAFHSMLKEENSDMKEEIEQIKDKIIELEKLNSEQKAQIDYLSIKSSVSKKGNSQNNMSVIQFADTSIIGGQKLTKKDAARKSHLEGEIKRLDEQVKLKEKELGSFSIINSGLSELKTSAEQIYQSFLCVKQVIEGTNISEEGILEDKPTINTSKCINSYGLSTNSITSSSQKDIQKKLEEVKCKFGDLKIFAHQLIILVKQRALSPNKNSKQSIPLSQIQNQIKMPNQSNSFTLSNNPDYLNSFQASYLNKTQIIQPPKMQLKDISVSEDSQSRTSSQKNPIKDKMVKYGEFVLKITQPNSPKNIPQTHQTMFSQFHQQPQPNQLQSIKKNPSLNPHFSQTNDTPGYLNPIEEQEQSKLQKNESNPLHNNSKFKVDGNIYESGSLKQSANFNQNFTLNNFDSVLKSRKSSESGIIGPVIEELDSFAGKINQESQELRNSQSKKGSEIEPRDMKSSKNIDYKRSKSWRSVNLLEENKFQLTSSEGMSGFPFDNRHETAKSEDRSQIELNKSIFLQARLRDVEIVLQEKQNQLIKLDNQLANLKKVITNITQQNDKLKRIIESKGLINLVDANLNHKALVDIGNQQHLINKCEDKLRLQNQGKGEKTGIHHIIPKVSSLIHQLQTSMNTCDSSTHKTNHKPTAYRQNFTLLLAHIYDLSKFMDFDFISKQTIPQNHPLSQKYIDTASQLINHLIETDSTKQQGKQSQIQIKSNNIDNRESIQQPQIVISLSVQSKINSKNQHKIHSIDSQKIDPEPLSLSKTLSLKNNKKDASFYGRLDKKQSLAPIKQRHLQQATSNQEDPHLELQAQRSFHTPSELYMTKNQIQNNLSSFKNDQNNQSISIVRKSNYTLNLQNQQELKDYPNQNGGVFILGPNQIVAGCVDDNSVENVLESHKSCQTIEIYVYENCKELQNVTVEFQGGKKNEQNHSDAPKLKQRKKSLIKKSENSLQKNNRKGLTLSQSSASEQKQPMISISESLLQVNKDKSRNKIKVDKKWSHGNELYGQINTQIQKSISNKNKVPVIKISRQRSLKSKVSQQNSRKNKERQQRIPMSQQKSQKSEKSQEGSQKSQQKSQKSRWSNSIGRFSQERYSKIENQYVSSKKNSRKLSFQSQVSQLSIEQQKQANRQENKKMNGEELVMYTQEQYLQLYKKYKAMQACLLEETERNNRKQVMYQSFLKEIKMKVKPYSKLSLEQRLFEAQKRIGELQKRVKEQEDQYDKQIRKALEQSDKLCQQYLIKLEKNFDTKRVAF